MASLNRRGMSNKELLDLLERKDKEIQQLDILLKEKINQISHLQRYVDELNDVLESPPSPGQARAALFGNRGRGLGISGEPSSKEANECTKAGAKKLSHFKKSKEERELIRDAIEDNDFLQNLEENQINEIIECMRPIVEEEDTYIIKEGDPGNLLYVLERGKTRVEKINKDGVNEFKREMGPKSLFGELAILYNTPRTASVKALEKCSLWCLERHTFQVIMMRTGLTKTAERIESIKGCPRFKDYSEELLGLIAEAFDQAHYENGDNIVLAGAKGQTMYMLLSGQVEASKELEDGEKETRLLYRHDYFGDKGLDGEETREETMRVISVEGASCLSIDRDTLNEVLKKHGKKTSIPSKEKTLTRPGKRDIPDKLKKARLGDLLIITTLGIGGFGRVELVQVGDDAKSTYALKQIKKDYVVQSSQQEHIINERKIMLECRSDFIVRLHRTYRNNKYVYMLMDTCLGGELWRHLRDRGPFEDGHTRFYVACAIEALAYLHARGIVYRDLKPENLLMDDKGYLKLVDFGFAKKIGHGKKTWTFCGTPDYVAPEIILNKGHDFAVDLWALGILMFELLTGNPPFTAGEAMRTYNMALKGIDSITFPRRITKNAKDLIKKLCREAPNERLGYGRAGIVEVQRHKWYDVFNWEGLRKKTLDGPVKPTIRGVQDTANFDEYPDDNEAVTDELSGWDKDFADIE